MIIISIITMLVVTLPFLGMVYLLNKLKKVNKGNSSWIVYSIKKFLVINLTSIFLSFLLSLSQYFVLAVITGDEFANYFGLSSYVYDYIIFPLSLIAVLILIIDIYKNRKKVSYD